MRLIDADKLQPDRMTNRGTVAISQGQIAKAPTVKPCKDAISRNNAITSICQWGTALERSGRYTITISEMKQECADMLCELPLAILEPTVCDIEQIRAEIEQLTSRYSISKERGGMGQVEWSDRLIKESEVLQIIDKYR